SLTMHDQDALPTGCNVFTLGDLREPARESVRAGMPSGSLAETSAQVSRLAQDNLLPLCEEVEAESREAAEDRAERDAEADRPGAEPEPGAERRSEEHTSELQSRFEL